MMENPSKIIDETGTNDRRACMGKCTQTEEDVPMLCLCCKQYPCSSSGSGMTSCKNYTPNFTNEPLEPEIGTGPFKTQIGGNHYQKKFPFCQPSEFFARNNIPFMEGNVCKYALRHDLKNGIEDLRKAKHYLEMIAHCQYGEEL